MAAVTDVQADVGSSDVANLQAIVFTMRLTS